jgi:hypothetical protein
MKLTREQYDQLRRLAGWVATRCGARPEEMPDAIAVGLLAAVEARWTWDPDGRATYVTHATWAMLGHVSTAVRRSLRNAARECDLVAEVAVPADPTAGVALGEALSRLVGKERRRAQALLDAGGCVAQAAKAARVSRPTMTETRRRLAALLAD